jgi:hypothetical protein
MPDDGKARAGWGWVWHIGSISLVTCQRRECEPTEAGWLKGLEIVGRR